MGIRSAIMRIILVLLALTAATAVIGIFIPGTNLVWRLVGTGVIGVVVGGVGLRFVTLLDRPSTQLAGLAGLVGCAVLGLVAGAFTMGVMDLLTPGAEEQWWFTLLLLIGATATTVVALRLHGAAERVAAFALIVVTVVAVVLGALAIWASPSPHDWSERSLWLFWTVSWFGTLGSFALVGLRRPDRAMPRAAIAIRVVGLIAAGVGATFLGLVITSLSSVTVVPIGALVANSIALPIALWTLLELARTPARFVWLPAVTVGAAAIAMGSIAVGTRIDQDATLFERLAHAASIVTVCGIVATLVISRVARSIAPPTRVADLADTIDLHCPLCKFRQELPVRVRNAPVEPGTVASRCGRCGLELVVVANVPKCGTCEHILLWATTANCPECGAAIGTHSGVEA